MSFKESIIKKIVDVGRRQKIKHLRLERDIKFSLWDYPWMRI